jgi:RNA polymerase sigma-70 factor (ECF subfamily)
VENSRMSVPASRGNSTEPDEEFQLISGASRGDAVAFSTLFHRHYPMIHAFAYRICLDSSEAQDIAQDTFIHAARALRTFSAPNATAAAAFRSWLYRIALNLTRDRHRRRKHQVQLAGEMAARQTGMENEHPPDFTPLHAALAALPENWRKALTLVFYEELSHAEAARVLGCAETTVSWRIFQAKRRLRKLLLPSGKAPPFGQSPLG